jgi:glycosyltransferase involved in cell wall biosynthesis
LTRKRILYIAMQDPQVPQSGACVRSHYFIHYMSEEFDIDLLHLEGSGHPPVATTVDTTEERKLRVASRTGLPFTQRDYFLFSRRLYSLACDRLAKEAYDFIFCDYGLAGIDGVLLARRFKVPLIYSSHNLEYRLYRAKARRDWRRWPLVPYVHAAEKAAVRRARLLIAITRSEADFYARWTDAAKIMVIPQGFDPVIFHPPAPGPVDGAKQVLFCGNFLMAPNRDAAREVARRIVDPVVARHPGTIFRFVGASPPTDVRHPNIEFTGFIHDYPDQLRRADVVISPLRVGAGFPTKIVEALACGRPVIATPVGARAIEPDYRMLEVCPLEEFPERIANALTERRTADPGDLERLRQRYSWSTNIGRLIERLKEHGAS